MLFETIPEYWKPYIEEMYEQWYDPTNEEDKKIMTEVSPALNTEKIAKPLLIVQGANDPRVNINESDQVVKNLRNRGIKVLYMVKYNEGHGFGHEENQIDFYKTMIGFFNENLK
jgi:dipeptidyl aminopeptidase/acylaminoacyl peptidase